MRAPTLLVFGRGRTERLVNLSVCHLNEEIAMGSNYTDLTKLEIRGYGPDVIIFTDNAIFTPFSLT